MSYRIRDKKPSDRERLAQIWTERYGGTTVISRGQVWHPLELDGFVAEDGARLVGAVTWRFHARETEVVTLDSLEDNRGIGTQLLLAVTPVAKSLGARRIWLITSNDNVRAVRFYQRRGWSIANFYRDAVTRARDTKPEIPLLGLDDIPIRDEIEFELVL